MVVREEDVIIIPWDEEMYNRAVERARLKQKWLDTWKKRSEEERFQNFLDGQLGEEGFRKFLEKEGIKYEYYDDIRTDDFKEKDKFDFKVFDANGKEIEVNVKSSKLKKTIVDTVDQNNILAYPSEVKPINTQPFIDYKNKNTILTGWANEEEMLASPPKALPGDYSDEPSETHQKRIKDSRPLNTIKETLGLTKQPNSKIGLKRWLFWISNFMPF